MGIILLAIVTALLSDYIVVVQAFALSSHYILQRPNFVLNEANYDMMPRKELQALAKQTGIKGNLKSSDIISQLKSLPPNQLSGNSISEPSSVNIKAPSRISYDSNIESIMRAQGINMKDLLTLRESLASAESTTFPASEKSPRIVKKLPKTAAPATSRADSAPREVRPAAKSIDEQRSTSVRMDGEKDVMKTRVVMSLSPPQHRDLTQTPTVHTAARSSTPPLRKPDPAVFSSQAISSPKKLVHPPKKPVDLSGVSLKTMLETLEQSMGFEGLYEHSGLNCFHKKPSINSSLKVLRSPEMEWARKKLEYLYIQHLKKSH